MEKVPRGVYTKEFKEEAVKLVTEAGLSVPEATRRLSVGKSTIEHWIRKARNGTLSDQGKATAGEMEIDRLRRENAELKMERNILKRPRTLQGSRCEVRAHENAAARLSHADSPPGPPRVEKRLLRMAQTPALQTGAGRGAPGGGDKGRPRKDPPDVRPGKIVARSCHPWSRSRRL